MAIEGLCQRATDWSGLAASSGHDTGGVSGVGSALALDGCDVHFWDGGGRGLPVVFSHGAGADHVMFEQQAEHLRMAGFRVLTWDLRGHGRSRPGGALFTAQRAIDDLLALVAHLGLDRPVLIGHSLGGNLSQAVVRRHPGLARGLIGVDCTWNTGPLSGSDRVLLRLAAPSLWLIPARWMPQVMANASAVTDAARADARRAFTQLSKREFIEVWRATVDLLDPDPAYRTPVPLCLIRGERDRTGNIATAMPRWARAEGVRDVVVPGAGHLVTQDAPEAATAAIERFLLGTLPEPG
jgi:pimeloyl-ACP methyl ester carboxylesterase